MGSNWVRSTLPYERPSAAGLIQGQPSLLHETVLSTLTEEQKYDGAAYKSASYISRPLAPSSSDSLCGIRKKRLTKF
jgi:hypothetical protein